MPGLLRVVAGPVLLVVLAVTSTPPVHPVEMTPSSDLADHYAVRVILPLAPVVAEGEWDYSTPALTVIPPPPALKKYATHDYGPVPALEGPILVTGGKYIGVPYVHGGTSPSGFDCSGFVQYVYAKNGISIPRTTGDIRKAGTVVTAAQAQPGDIMYWSGHVALYVAPGWRLDANHAGSTIQIRPSFGTPVYLHID